MSIHKKRGRYVVRWREGERNRSQTFDCPKAAARFEHDQREQRQMGAHAKATPSKMPLAKWLDTWWDRHSPEWEQSTKKTRRPLLNKWVVPYIGGVRLFDLGTPAILDWRRRIIADGASNQTANNVMRVLSSALGAAALEGALPANPCQPVKRLPVKREPVRALTPSQVEAIRDELPSERDRLLWATIAYAGLRTEEALALRWRDVHARHLLVCRAVVDGEEKGTKTGQHRTIPMLAPLRDDFDALASRERVDDALVFPNRDGGFLDLHNWRGRIFDQAAAAAGLGTTTPYDGRHAFASLLIHAGVSVVEVAARMGNLPETTLRHYAHLLSMQELEPQADPERAIYDARRPLPGNNPVPQTFPTKGRRHLRLVA